MEDEKLLDYNHQKLDFVGVRYCHLVFLLASIDILGPLATDAHVPSLPQMSIELHCALNEIQLSVLLYGYLTLLICVCVLLYTHCTQTNPK